MISSKIGISTAVDFALCLGTHPHFNLKSRSLRHALSQRAVDSWEAHGNPHGGVACFLCAILPALQKYATSYKFQYEIALGWHAPQPHLRKQCGHVFVTFTAPFHLAIRITLNTWNSVDSRLQHPRPWKTVAKPQNSDRRTRPSSALSALFCISARMAPTASSVTDERRTENSSPT